MIQTAASSNPAAVSSSRMTDAQGDTASPLSRQGSVARTNAIAMLKRAASHREMKAKAETPTLPGAYPSAETTPPLASDSSRFDQLVDSTQNSFPATTAEHSFDASAARHAPHKGPSTHANGSTGLLAGALTHVQSPVRLNRNNTIAATRLAAPLASDTLLVAPSPSDSSDRSRSPMFQDKSNHRAFNRSPLPSLEQLRARILLERESEGLQRSASTSAASQAARAYALEKLLGNSGTDVFYDHTPEGTLIGRGAATPSPTPISGRDDNLTDMASDDESAHETRLKRQSLKNRPSLRRSRTVNGLTAMAEAQNKADFVQGVFLAVPGPASNRISRIHQRRIERQSILQLASNRPSEAAVPEEAGTEPMSSLDALTEAAPSLSRQQSQRQVARTEMMRKLSTRGRGNASSSAQPASGSKQTADISVAAPREAVQHPRLPTVITDSPAVDETISPVGLVIRPPSSPAPPHISQLDPLSSAPSPPKPTMRQALSPASAAGLETHMESAMQSQDDRLVASSPGLTASSSAVSLASRYAPSTGTNATARHAYERDRESAIALLNNEDSFAFEASPSVPTTSIDAVASRTVNAAASHHSAASEAPTQDEDDVDPALQASSSHGDYGSESDGLNVDFSDVQRKRRRAGLVGLGLGAGLSQASQGGEVTGEGSTSQQVQQKKPADLSPETKGGAHTTKRASELRRSLARLRVQPSTQGPLSSPGSYTDDEPLEDDAFYQLYSPGAGGFDDDDESEEHEGDTEEHAHGSSNQHSSAGDQGFQRKPASQRGDISLSATQGLGLSVSGGAAGHGVYADLPATPPQRLFHRDIAAVPSDPSPSTETEFGETRRTPFMGSSPGGFNLPLRLSNSLMSTAQAIISDSPASDPSPVLRAPEVARKTRGDWPMSVASSGTLPPSRESIESRNEVEARVRSSEEAGTVGAVPAIGSPLLELPEDDVIKENEDDGRRPNDSANSEFELLAVPSARAKRSERVQAMLGSSFVAEYGADLPTSRSPSIGGARDEENRLQVPNSDANGSRLSDNHSNISVNEISDVDGEVDDAYLRKVDRMVDKLGKLARTNKGRLPAEGTNLDDTRSPNAAATPELLKSATGSKFTEHVSESTSHQPQRLSTDLSALVGNEKLHPFPGLSQASPVQIQEGFSSVAGHVAHSNSALAATAQTKNAQPVVTDSPPSASGHKDEQETNGKQIGLFSSLRRKASSLRRTPSSVKEGSSFWARRAKRDESPKLPSEPTFISAPILTTATPGPASIPSQPIVTVDKPQTDTEQDATGENELFGDDKRTTDLQRNVSISSVVSARVRTDLQDGTADIDGSSSSSDHPSSVSASSLAPNTAAMIHRYSRMLSNAGSLQPMPGVTKEDLQDPPRKLLATNPVFQVISATTIKDRYLFLFSDILVIAKPVAGPGAEAGQIMGKMKQAAVLPSLSWRFAVKNILELHRLKVSVTTNTRAASAKTRAQNPVLWGFVSHFSKDPDAAVRALVAKSGLEPTPASIAQLLYQTPELDRDDLTHYLSHPSRREILKAYVSQHRHVGVSIESALRSLLLDLRFPTDLDAFEALLVHFAQSWTQHNASMIKPSFTSQIASDLVFAIMALNDALHTGSQAGPASVTSPNFPRPVTVVTPGLFSAPCKELSKSDFVAVFRQHDPEGVLSDRTLSRIYLSIRSEPLVQALDRFEPRFTIRVKGGKLPTRLTYAQPAEPVTLVIPAPDPDLAVRLYAQDTTFEPPVLTFSTSNEASFTMWTKTLGPKHIVFVRAGRNARFYAGTEVDEDTSASSDDSPLPRSFTVTVERAFMKHSFTLSSVSGSGGAGGGAATKRFMFSFEDGEKVEYWTRLIREQAEKEIKAKAVRAAAGAGGGGAPQRAVETASLQVLRETLIAPEDDQRVVQQQQQQQQQGLLNRALTIGTGTSNSLSASSGKATGSSAKPGLGGELGSATAARNGSSAGLGLISNPNSATASRWQAGSSAAMLDRAPSTSRHYYAASGVGRHERELLIPPSNLTVGHQAHTKGSASLSLYPPSTSVRPAFTLLMARSNSARSASSPVSNNTPLPTPPETTSLPLPRSAHSSLHDQVRQGTQIVQIARLNSLLPTLVAHAHHPTLHQG